MGKLSSLFCTVAVAAAPGCAVGPLVNHETAKTVGRSHHELVGGYGAAGYVVKWNYGLTENLDLGLHWESLSIGVRAKYAFVNNEKGWSLAAGLGTGVSAGGSHYYGDLIGSHMVGSWEPYGALRLVHVKNAPLKFKDKDTGEVKFSVSSIEYDYGQFILGVRYWFSPHWLFSLEASSLFAISSGLKVGNGALLGGSFGYRF